MNASTEPPNYEYFEHTADVGILIRGREIEEIFIHGALALTDLITNLEAVRPQKGYKITIEALDTADLLVKWLNELVYLSDADRFLPCEVRILSLKSDKLHAEIRGETMRNRRHPQKHEVKSVTHHKVSISGDDKNGWQAQVIVDI